jgi:energy-coupling factor transporter transmembrane protein EcfT
MSNPTPQVSDVGSTSAIVSLLTLIISFFNTTHVWLQNMTLIVSFIGAFIAIISGIRTLKSLKK